MKLTKTDQELIKRAYSLIKKRYKARRFTVSSVLITNKDNIYEGLDIELLSGPCSNCAEYAAISSMIANGEEKIKTIVAVANDGKILPSCGKCRELIYSISGGETFNPTWIIIINHIDLSQIFHISKKSVSSQSGSISAPMKTCTGEDRVF